MQKKQTNDFNLASIILDNMQCFPTRDAIIFPIVKDGVVSENKCYSFQELANKVQTIRGFLVESFSPEEKVGLLLNIDIDLYACVVAMFAENIIPVFMEPGMGRKNIKIAMNAIGLDSFIGKKEFLKYRWFIPGFWKKNFYSLNSKGLFIKRVYLNKVENLNARPTMISKKNITALISFTSGSSGIPKGANRTHSSLFFQHQALKASFPNISSDKDLTCFPMVVLHNLCCGVPSVMPPLDFKNISQFDPKLMLDYLIKMNVTRFTAAPKFLNVLCDYMIKENLTLNSIRELAAGGAVVERSLVKKLMCSFPNAKGNIIYGSTEAEPMAKISFNDYLTKGHLGEGHLVGKPVAVANIKILDYNRLDTMNLPANISELELSDGSVGELVVSGEHVLASYIHNEEANREIKLNFGDGVIWHRTQDLAKFDSDGNLWLYGRLKDIIFTKEKYIYPFPIEKELNQFFPRSALIQQNNNIFLFIETSSLSNSDSHKIKTILDKFNINPIIKTLSYLPVDKRHHSKLNRKELQKIARKTHE